MLRKSKTRTDVLKNNSSFIPEEKVPQDKKPLLGDDIWLDFQFLPSQFDEYCFNHWYLLPILFYAVLLPFDAIYDIYAGNLEISNLLNNSLTKFHLTDWIFLSLAIAVGLTVIAFNKWRNTIPTVFQSLLIKGRISSFRQPNDIHQEYQLYILRYQQDLYSKRRFVLAGISIIIASALFYFVSLRYTPSNIISSRDESLFAFIIGFFWIFAPGIIAGYFFGIASWAIIVTSFYVKNITKKFQLIIQPSHPDKCGGLKPLGDFCFGMALPILIGAILLGLYGIGGVVYPSLTRDIVAVPIVANVSLFVFVLPLASIAFFLPLWNIHREMVRKKEEYEDKFSIRIEKLEIRMHNAIDAGEIEKAKNVREEIEIVQTLHPEKIGYPSWPFDRHILLTFLTTQIVPLISLAVTLISQWPKH